MSKRGVFSRNQFVWFCVSMTWRLELPPGPQDALNLVTTVGWRMTFWSATGGSQLKPTHLTRAIASFSQQGVEKTWEPKQFKKSSQNSWFPACKMGKTPDFVHPILRFSPFETTKTHGEKLLPGSSKSLWHSNSHDGKFPWTDPLIPQKKMAKHSWIGKYTVHPMGKTLMGLYQLESIRNVFFVNWFPNFKQSVSPKNKDLYII